MSYWGWLRQYCLPSPVVTRGSCIDLAGCRLHGLSSVQAIYAPYSAAILVIALQFAVILISVGWVLVVLSKNSSFVWGSMAVVGLVVGSASVESVWLLGHWQYADLFFRVLPPALFAILLIYETLHLRSVHRNGIGKTEPVNVH